MHFGYELFIGFRRLLKWIEEKLPDKPGLGFTLLVTGAVFVGLARTLFSQQNLGPGAANLQSVAFFLGGTCGAPGGYILFRRAVWMVQDKLAPRITTLRLK
jgi:hypothetical protein